MKKIILLLIMSLAFSLSGNAQIKTVDILKTEIGTLEAIYSKNINLEKKTTFYNVFIGFQNLEYSSITDIKSVFITKSTDLKILIKDLKMAFSQMETKQNMQWNKELYNLILYDFSDKLYFEESRKKGNGYTTISKQEVEELILWLESIQFGKE